MSLENVWGVPEQDLLIAKAMRVEVRPISKDGPASSTDGVCLTIDPQASSYLDSTVEIGPSQAHARRFAHASDFVVPPSRPVHAGSAVGLRPKGTIDADTLRPALQRLFGFDSFRKGQVEGICEALTGRDTLLLLPTGYGKSLVFQLAALLLPGATLVVEAWRALIDDQARSLQDLGWSRVLAIHKDRPLPKGVELDQFNLIYLAPERLYVESFQEPLNSLIRKRGLDLLVVDEAHAVSEAGHSFRPSYLGLVDRLNGLCRKQAKPRPIVLALTATAAEVVVRDACGLLGITNPPITLMDSDDGSHSSEDAQVKWAFVRENLEDQVVVFPAVRGELGMKEGLVAHLPEMTKNGKGIIFCSSKNKWFSQKDRTSWFGVQGTKDTVAAVLCEATEKTGDSARNRAAVSIAHYVGGDGMSPEERQSMVQRFGAGLSKIMVATSAFGTGIDLPDVRWVVHVGFPAGLEAYYQELGRAGRDGAPANGLLLVDKDSEELLDELRSASQQEDSFVALRKFLGIRGLPGRGGIARQLQFLVGAGVFDPSSTVRPDRPSSKKIYFPGFPGWRFENAVVDAYVVEKIVGSDPDGETEIPFLPDWDPLVWKSVHRLKELGVIDGLYRRTFHLSGINRFVVRRTRETLNRSEALLKGVERAITRLRGAEIGVRLAAETKDQFNEHPAYSARVLRCCAVLLKSTYEIVRKTRLGSLVQLLSYSETTEQQERHRHIEDYFAHDALWDELSELAQQVASTADWQKALFAMQDQPYWREGMLNRLADAYPSSGLPDFLLLLTAIRETRAFQISYYLQELLQNQSIAVAPLIWAFTRAVRRAQETGAEGEDVLFEAVAKLGDELKGRARHNLDRLVLEVLPDTDGHLEVVHTSLARWVEEAIT